MRALGLNGTFSLVRMSQIDVPFRVTDGWPGLVGPIFQSLFQTFAIQHERRVQRSLGYFSFVYVKVQGWTRVNAACGCMWTQGILPL
jgi:hypothetical protein